MPRKKPTVGEVRGWYTALSRIYAPRNTEFSVLRDVFNGNSVDLAAGLATGANNEFQDKKKVAYNMINSSIRRFMDEMSAPAFVRAVPRGISLPAIDLAERRQKALTRLDMFEDMDIKRVQAAFYQGLFDKATWYVRPDPDKPMLVEIGLVMPETYFPVPKSSNWSEKGGIIIAYREYSIDDLSAHQMDLLRQPDPNNLLGAPSLISKGLVLEYWDEDWMLRLKGEEEDFSVAIQHEIGVHIFEEAHNIPIPHQHRGQGDADQSVGSQAYLNKLISDQADVLDYLANPIVVVRGSRSGTTALTWGPRAIWDLERDGSAEILTWAGAPPTMEAQILRMMQGIEDNTGLSSPAFGREIPSGVSGETVRSILAGFNTRVGTKQTLMAKALSNVYRKAQRIWETQFPTKKLEVSGEKDGEEGTFLQGKELNGWYDVQVGFQPQNESVRTFSEINKMKEGVQSRLRTMQNLGVPQPLEEWKRIIKEKQIDLAMAQAANAAMGGGAIDPATGQPIAPPGGGIGVPQGALTDPRQPRQPFDISQIPALGAALGGADPGDAEADFGLAALTPSAGEPIMVTDILDALTNLDLKGSAFLSGEIVEEGQTAGRFTIIAQNETDADRIARALGPLSSRADIQIKDKSKASGPFLNVARARTPRRQERASPPLLGGPGGVR